MCFLFKKALIVRTHERQNTVNLGITKDKTQTVATWLRYKIKYSFPRETHIMPPRNPLEKGTFAPI